MPDLATTFWQRDQDSLELQRTVEQKHNGEWNGFQPRWDVQVRVGGEWTTAAVAYREDAAEMLVAAYFNVRQTARSVRMQ